MKKNLLIIFLMSFFCNTVFAFDLDLTVDDDIRKNYNSGQLIQDVGITEDEILPELPKILQNNAQTKGAATESYNKTTASLPKLISNGSKKIHKGTSFNVVNSTKISDFMQKGATVKFAVKTPIAKKNYTIPAYAVFTGEVTEVHQPQITCNGGLVVIRIKTLSYNNNTYPVNAYIINANDKMIFLNNIKGKRTYLQTMWKKGNWGRTIFNNMLTLTIKMGAENSTVLFSPFPFAYGTICLGANALTSPITAFFSKGGHVSINSGNKFKIRLLDDAYIN